MKKVYKKREEDAVSPVIATILMVAITVVLAAVLYVMVIGMGEGGGNIETPMGLTQQGKTTTSVTLLIASAPTDAMVYGTSVALTQSGTPTPVTNVTVYSSAAVIIATYDGATGVWTFPGTLNQDTAAFGAGMTIRIQVAAGVSSGDKLVFSSGEGYYGTTTFTVQ